MTLIRGIEMVVLIGALVTTVTVLWHKLGFATMKKRTSDFLDDWNGEKARPGYEGRPSFPERMAEQEKQSVEIRVQLTGVRDQASAIEDRTRVIEDRTTRVAHDMRDELGSRLGMVEAVLAQLEDRTKQLQRNGGSSMADQVHLIGAALERLEDAVQVNRVALETVDNRVTDHRLRNDAQREEMLRYLAEERQQLTDAKQALEASVSELLMVEGRERRESDIADANRATLDDDEGV